MRRRWQPEVYGFLARKRQLRARQKVVAGLACLAVCCTTYALILPAVTLESSGPELRCGLEEHIHNEGCYEAELICALEEGEGHTHRESCYETTQVLVCGWEESEGHSHSESCYDEDGDLTCGLEESEGHSHSENCYEIQSVLVCQKFESEGHIHTEDCYGSVLTCVLQEHTHTQACYSPNEQAREEQAQVEEVIALISALPSQEEIREVLTGFEDAGDEDGYDAYLTEVAAQASAAYEAYSILTEEQQEAVTNADKLLELEWLWEVQTLEPPAETIPPALEEDGAHITGIQVTSIVDGTEPFDQNEGNGNDAGPGNKIVRTFDSVTYNFHVEYGAYQQDKTYSEARVKLEFVLPLTQEQAEFDQSAMAWMDQTEGYAPKLITETRMINDKETSCQVLTCYKHLRPNTSEHDTAVPGNFEHNVTINVKSMKNGDQFAPIFSAAMEHNTWDGECPQHKETEKKTVVADEITVSAAPKYNIKIGGQSTYKDTFDFNSGGEKAQQYGDGYNIGSLTGRVMKLGVAVELYNDNASKGFKGIELPNGDPITFDLVLSAEYQINTGEQQGTTVNVTDNYLPRLWSCDGNVWTSVGQANSDGRVLNEAYGCAQAIVPYNSGDGKNACYQGGTWTATQMEEVIHVTVSDYEINMNRMPIQNGDAGNVLYGEELGIGVFSAGEVWIVQPFNTLNSSSTDPNFDIVNEYGPGSFSTHVEACNMKATTISGVDFADEEDTTSAQTKHDDDEAHLQLELVLPGNLQNRVRYANYDNPVGAGVGVSDIRDGFDYAPVGTDLYLMGGFSYAANNEVSNTLYWGTNLTKFYGSALEFTGNAVKYSHTGTNSSLELNVYYATKPDGSDWKSDEELKTTYEDGLKFYSSLSDIPKGHLCVGVLFCFKGPGDYKAAMPYYYGYVPAKVKEDMSLANQTFMLASTSRVWTKSMFEGANISLDNIPDWSKEGTSLNSFPQNHLKSANIEGSTWYTKTTYKEDGNIDKAHNSDWYHWGDTLLVIGYKTQITKNLLQKEANQNTKNTYNLDYGQRVVDFKLQPYVRFDKQPEQTNDVSTTVTIVDTLPQYLSYMPDSAFYGGEYSQTSVDGGTRGEVEGGTVKEPAIVRNADGTTTLTWVFENIQVGDNMLPIYYSAYIGGRSGGAGNDVPAGTHSIKNTVHIYATHDKRPPTTENGNYAEEGLTVVRGASSSYGKYVQQTVAERDGKIDYVIYYDNTSANPVQPVLMDTMPYNGELGSEFKGSYYISSFQIEPGKCDFSALNLYYTTDEWYCGKTLRDLQDNQNAPVGQWIQAQISSDGTVPALTQTQPLDKPVVAWVINCTGLNAEQSIVVDYSIQLVPEPSSTIQSRYVNTFSSGTTTTTTETPTVSRSLEGLTWLDADMDGIQDEGETRISGVKVTLLKLNEATTEYEEYHYQGDPNKDVVSIETGKMVSVRAGGSDEAADYETGRYKFTDLPAGTFGVRFEDGTGQTKISTLIASPANRGGDDTLDSDGIPSPSSGDLKKTEILDIDMPKAEDMLIAHYESKHHDSGFYEKGPELPNTGGPGTGAYTLGGLALMAGAVLWGLTQRKKEAPIN